MNTRNSEKIAESETDEDIDPLADVEIPSDTEGSDDDSNLDTGPDNDTDIIMNDTLFHDILLDSVTNSEDEDEDEDSDPEDEADYEVELIEKGVEELVGFNHGFNGTELGIVPPQPTCRVGNQRSPHYTAGCVWTEEDWSVVVFVRCCFYGPLDPLRAIVRKMA